MKVKENRLVVAVLFTGVLLVGLTVLPGCDNPEPKRETVKFIPIVEPTADLARPAEQTTCPVMGGRIDRNIYTQYKGQRVYFCCAGCEERFLSSPETYVSKLPQFAK